MSKFSKFKILSVEYELEDNDGNMEMFNFKPLPFSLYPDVYELIQLMSDAGLISDTMKESDFISKLNKEVIAKLTDVEFQMVKNSYDLPDEEIQDFVGSNMFTLIEPLMSLLNRGEKSSPRKVEAALK